MENPGSMVKLSPASLEKVLRRLRQSPEGIPLDSPAPGPRDVRASHRARLERPWRGSWRRGKSKRSATRPTRGRDDGEASSLRGPGF